MRSINDNESEPPCCFMCGKGEADGVVLVETSFSLAKLVQDRPLICNECTEDINQEAAELRKLGPQRAIERVRETLKGLLDNSGEKKN